ncbi:MAG: transposase, partial [Tannerella sp.]|nr:transposase [Tannerella sp.]
DIKQIKYTIGFDGFFPNAAKIYTEQKQLNENLSIPQVIKMYSDKNKGNIYVFDRGVNSRSVFEDFQDSEIEFVIRLNPGAVYESVEIKEGQGRMLGNLQLIKDETVYLYAWINKGKIKKRTQHLYRLITAKNRDGETFLFLTNLFDPDAQSITDFYRK